MVGLIPLFAVEVIDIDDIEQAPEFKERLEWFLNYRPELASLVSHWEIPGQSSNLLLSLLRGNRMKKLLRSIVK